MFRLYTTFVSTVLEFCFDFVLLMFRLCSADVSTVLDLCFDFLDQNSVCFDCARLKIASRPQNFIRKTARARLSKSKHKSSTSTRVLFDKFLNLLKPKP